MSEMRTEWRCVIAHEGGSRVEEPCQNEADAREWARLERQDYPRADVSVEWREVTPWTRADD